MHLIRCAIYEEGFTYCGVSLGGKSEKIATEDVAQVTCKECLQKAVADGERAAERLKTLET